MKKSKDQLRTEAKERQAEHNALTPRKKINKLDKRLGKNVGAVKERARLKGETKSEN